MKKRPFLLILILCFAASLCGAAAAGGSREDPLISRAYLTDTYLPGLLDKVKGSLTAPSGDGGTMEEVRVKAGDRVTLETGGTFLLLAGEATLETGSAADVTAGTAVSAGAALEPRHRYIITEQGAARAAVTSDTAVIATLGGAEFAYGTGPDCNMLARALKEMGLFQGKSLSIGEGYDLEAKPTRIEGLVMFIRMLGEEKDALAFTGSIPFRDIPADYWGYRYVAYAYEKGYTKGTDADDPLFSPGDLVDARQYMTFVLRALGYSDGAGDFAWDGALEFGREKGLLTVGEYGKLSTGGFYRAQVAYLSYYALSMEEKDGGGTLLSRLEARGAVSAGTAAAAMGKVTSPRIL